MVEKQSTSVRANEFLNFSYKIFVSDDLVLVHWPAVIL